MGFLSVARLGEISIYVDKKRSKMDWEHEDLVDSTEGDMEHSTAVWIRVGQVYFSEMRYLLNMGSLHGFLCHTD